jgi:hypothetical protein
MIILLGQMYVAPIWNTVASVYPNLLFEVKSFLQKTPFEKNPPCYHFSSTSLLSNVSQKLQNNAFQNLKFIELFPSFNEDNFTNPNAQLIRNLHLYNASTKYKQRNRSALLFGWN